MDTRRKIVRNAAGWRAPAGAVSVIGLFDPLLAAHAAQLEAMKGDAATLVVCIDSGEDAILPQEARAELVAGLRCVDAVVLDPSLLPPDAVDVRAPHLAWRAAFLERVRSAAERCEPAQDRASGEG